MKRTCCHLASHKKKRQITGKHNTSYVKDQKPAKKAPNNSLFMSSSIVLKSKRTVQQHEEGQAMRKALTLGSKCMDR